MTSRRRRKILIGGVAALLAVLVVAPFLVPVDTYLRQIEQVASTKLGDPVRIRDAHLQFLPTPRAVVEGLDIGDPPVVRVQRIVAFPELGTLFDAQRVIRDLRIEGLAVDRAALARIREWTRSDPNAGPPAVRLVALSATAISSEILPLGHLAAEASFGSDGKLAGAKIHTEDGKLALVATPDGGKFNVELTAKAWQVPVGPPLVLDALKLNAVVSDVDADIPALAIQLYGGTLQGKAGVDWRKGFIVRSTLRGERLDLGRLLPVVSPGTRLTGLLTTDARISAQAPEAEQLAKHLRVEATFDVANGVLQGVDLVEAAKSLIGASQKGGETRFDHLSGVATVDSRGYRVRQLVVSSGVLHATGQVDVSAQQQLSGRIEAEVKAGISLLKMPLNVSGTVANPSVAPTGAAVAGAIAGTAVAGPLGTTVGARVGSFFGKLFGSDDKKK